MADIQVPQTNPNAPQVVNPFPIVDSYLNRQQQAQQYLGQSAIGLGERYNTLRQQKLQNQLAALNAYASIAKAVGPDAANQVAGQIPMMPNWNPSQQPQTQPQTPPVSQGPNQDQQPSPYIAASINAGHPDVAGVGSFHSAPLTDLSGQIAALNAQMPNYANKGEWGAEQQRQLSARIQGLQQQQAAANAPEQFTANEANTERRFQQTQSNEKGRARAAVAEKVTPTLTAASQLESVFNQMSNINADPNNKSVPFTGDLGAKYAKMVPSTKSKWALNQAQAESQADVGAGAIEKLVEGRYNDQQMARIKDAMFPTGNELGTPRAAQKLAFFKQYVQQMKTGSVNQANAALDSIAGGSFNPSALATPAGTSPTNANQGGVHSEAMQWAQAHPNDPRAKAIMQKAQSALGGQ